MPLVKRIVMAIASLGLATYIEVDDLVQEASISLVSIIESYNPTRGSLSAYIRKAIRHDVLDIVRRERRVGAPISITGMHPGRLARTHGISVEKIDFKIAKSALTDRQYDALFYVYGLGHTEEEAATILGIRQPPLHRLIERAIAILKISLENKSA